jgi:hypothetical protein
MLLGLATSRENVGGKYTLYFFFVLYDQILFATQASLFRQSFDPNEPNQFCISLSTGLCQELNSSCSN